MTGATGRIANPITGIHPGCPCASRPFPQIICPKRRAISWAGASPNWAVCCSSGGVGALSVALATWSVQDPSWNHAAGGTVRNVAGPAGAIAADLIMQMSGVAVVAVLPPMVCWGWSLLTRRHLRQIKFRAILLTVGGLAATALASSLPTTDRWPLPSGFGGIVGDGLLALPRRILGNSATGMMIVALAFAGVAILALTASAGFGLKPEPGEDDEDIDTAYDWVPIPKSLRQPFEDDADGEPGMALVSVGAAIHAGLSAKAALSRLVRRSRGAAEAAGRSARPGSTARPTRLSRRPTTVRFTIASNPRSRPQPERRPHGGIRPLPIPRERANGRQGAARRIRSCRGSRPHRYPGRLAKRVVSSTNPPQPAF